MAWMLSVVLCGTAYAQSTPERALFLGNSYTQFNELHNRVADLLRDTVPALATTEASALTQGGLRLPDHVDRAMGADARWVDALNGAPGRWATVVLQDQSQVPGFPETEPYWMDSADAVPVLDGLAAAQGAETMLFMTWGRRDGDPSNPELFADFLTMNDRLDAGYRAYATRPADPSRTIWIAPVGRAFAAVYHAVADEGLRPEDPGTRFFALYDSDGSHPSPFGSAVAAGVFVRSLTGWSPQWVRIPPGVAEEDLPIAAKAAALSVVPFADLPYSWAVSLSEYTQPADALAVADLVVSGTTRCWTVGVDASAGPFDQVVLGSAHTAAPGCGGMYVLESGALTADTVVVGDDGSGEGALVVAGGVAEISTLTADRGRVELQDGRLTVDTYSGGVSVFGGTFALRAGASGGSLTLRGGTLALDPSASPALTLTSATLDGTLSALSVEADGSVLVDAETLELGDSFVAEVPDGWTVSREDTDGGAQLVAHAPGGGGSSGGGGGSGGTDDGTVGEDADDASVDEGASKAPSGGCAVTAGALSWGALLGGVGLVLARRRRKS